MDEREAGAAFGVRVLPLTCTQSAQPSPRPQRSRRRGTVIDSWEKARLELCLPRGAPTEKKVPAFLACE